eukprot:Plantae.Rhodophyta-Purpureofilum_apyrenoidigerum.ctg7272.p1 GENE.Plantae.Rhodophyta-Purpureofilum_apyrenoidigerum.ctg7272~~Plantae.Rhodophyta-Purpureofilum_apyrenoidigerum.ctg7272.p1  ORF type:complete len:147 (+),score=42.57 Plantae.Rhodophyta-Purpureofilum_apyrenoidigerum.ctg7272:38-478(+)
MASGIAVSEQCKTAFNELLKDRKHKAVFLKISDDLTEVVVDSTISPAEGGAEDQYATFLKELPEADCRYILYDFEYTFQDIPKNRVVMLLWSPEYSKIKAKMMYASSKQAVLNALDGIQTQIQGTAIDEIDYKAVKDHIAATSVKY